LGVVDNLTGSDLPFLNGAAFGNKSQSI